MQTKSYADAADADADDADADADDADADADGIHTKNNMSPTPSEGGHNNSETPIQQLLNLRLCMLVVR